MSDIKDVAQLAGVSIATVSRVISNSSHPVNAETRRRVLEAAAALHYAPNPLARALANEESHLIGVIVGDVSDPYFAAIVRGIGDAARAQRYSTVLCNTERVQSVELDYLRLLGEYSADGVILVGGGATDRTHQKRLDEAIDKFRANQVPVIALGDHLSTVPQVTIDNVQAYKELTAYLIGLGHRHIGVIRGPGNLTTSQLRLKGYRAALTAAKIPFDPELVFAGDFTFDGGQNAADYFLTRSPRPTAILGANDRDALGCLFRLQHRGVDVPGEISVAGFDDVDIAAFVHPSLTTVRIPTLDIGRTGFTQLLRALHGDAAVEHKLCLPHSLVVRDSTAPRPRRTTPRRPSAKAKA